jgi:hypothetical protein
VTHFGLDQFPILAVLVDETNQLDVVLERPFRLVNVGTRVVLVVLLDLLSITVYIKIILLLKCSDIFFQF